MDINIVTTAETDEEAMELLARSACLSVRRKLVAIGAHVYSVRLVEEW